MCKIYIYKTLYFKYLFYLNRLSLHFHSSSSVIFSNRDTQYIIYTYTHSILYDKYTIFLYIVYSTVSYVLYMHIVYRVYNCTSMCLYIYVYLILYILYVYSQLHHMYVCVRTFILVHFLHPTFNLPILPPSLGIRFTFP